MLDFQPIEQGKVCSLPQYIHWSQEFPESFHQTGPYLASQSAEGGAGLQDVVEGLRTCATRTWEVGEALTVSSCQFKDCECGTDEQTPPKTFLHSLSTGDRKKENGYQAHHDPLETGAGPEDHYLPPAHRALWSECPSEED